MDTLEIWHKFVATQDSALLAEILTDDCLFHSPVVWKPKEGKTIVTKILTAASQIFDEFEYVRQIMDEKNAVLEFEAKIGELTVRGVDIMEFDVDGKIADFEVMIRPANGMQAVGMAMAEKLMIED